MAEAQSFSLEIKNAQGNYVPLYPVTTVNQVNGWNAQECFGAYVFELTVDGWSNKQQTFALDTITDKDIVYCSKILEGNVEQMKKQDVAYGLLDPIIGVESLNGQIRFTTREIPSDNYKVQIFWTR